MTQATDWLTARHGVSLTDGELDAIRDFSLLWGLFEAQAMGTRGSQEAVVAAVDRMTIPAPLPDSFANAVAFWRDRYWKAGAKTGAFDALNFAPNPHRTATLAVLDGTSGDPAAVVTALLQISMRLRNNLFHGVKWQYLLQGQVDNLRHAGAVLMKAIELTPPGSA